MSHVYITEDGARISKRGGYFVLSRSSEVLFEVPEETLESLTLIGRVELSSGGDRAVVAERHSGYMVIEGWLLFRAIRVNPAL